MPKVLRAVPDDDRDPIDAEAPAVPSWQVLAYPVALLALLGVIWLVSNL